MGVAKHKIEVPQDAWLQTAYSKSYRCALCGVVIAYCDQDAYARSGVCGAHAPSEGRDEDRRDH
jgi:hypothetical protein